MLVPVQYIFKVFKPIKNIQIYNVKDGLKLLLCIFFFFFGGGGDGVANFFSCQKKHFFYSLTEKTHAISVHKKLMKRKVFFRLLMSYFGDFISIFLFLSTPTNFSALCSA